MDLFFQPWWLFLANFVAIFILILFIFCWDLNNSRLIKLGLLMDQIDFFYLCLNIILDITLITKAKIFHHLMNLILKLCILFSNPLLDTLIVVLLAKLGIFTSLTEFAMHMPCFLLQNHLPLWYSLVVHSYIYVSSLQ